jgi:hypothetical protein
MRLHAGVLPKEAVAAFDEIGGIRRRIRFLASPSPPAMGC